MALEADVHLSLRGIYGLNIKHKNFSRSVHNDKRSQRCAAALLRSLRETYVLATYTPLKGRRKYSRFSIVRFTGEVLMVVRVHFLSIIMPCRLGNTRVLAEAFIFFDIIIIPIIIFTPMSLFISSLNSGSNANCYYIGNSSEAVLVDAGLSCRETEKRMRLGGLSMDTVKAIFISHDLSVVRFVSDRIMVMHKGKIIEEGPSDEIYFSPQNEYTKKLIEAIPGRWLKV